MKILVRFNMRCLFCTLIASFFFLACGRNTPYGVLPEKKMQKVLWEMAQANEFLSSYVYSRNPEINKVSINDAMIDRVCKVNKINKETLNKSLDYYHNNPEKLIVIFDSIIIQQKRENGDTISGTNTPLLENPLRPTLVQ